MCGIIGYVGSRDAKPLLLEGLRRLEYRGYDTAGIALREDDELDYVRAVGNLSNLVEAAGVATGERVRVLLGHCAVRRPACVAEPVMRVGAVRARRLHQVGEIADGTHVVERVVLAQRDPCGVVAAVLEPAQSFEQKRLCLA